MLSKILLILIIFAINNSVVGHSSSILKNKVFDAGSETFFNNFEKCKFYFECDCCASKFIFINDSNFYLITYCWPDMDVSSGKYIISDDHVLLYSDGRRIFREHNWDSLFNKDAVEYFIKDSTGTKYQSDLLIDSCEGIMLVLEQEQSSYIAIETDLKIKDELEELKLIGLLELLEKNK